MTFMTAADKPHASVLVFNAKGQVLVRKDNDKLGIPCTAVKPEEDIRGAAVRVSSQACLITPSKMHPFFGFKEGDKFHTVFLVTHRTTPHNNPLEVEGNSWADPWDLCHADTSTSPLFYKELFRTIFEKVIPAVVV